MKLTRLSVFILLLILPVLSAGCETGLGGLFKDKPGPAPKEAEAAAGEEVYLLRVDQISRDRETCSGLAALAMVIQFWSQDQESARFIEGLECPEKGSDPQELSRMAVGQGFRSLTYRGGLPDLFRQLTAGRPLIVAFRGGEGLKFLVLSGYYQDGRLVANDPLKGRRVYPIQDFMELWQETDYSTVAVSPKS